MQTEPSSASNGSGKAQKRRAPRGVVFIYARIAQHIDKRRTDLRAKHRHCLILGRGSLVIPDEAPYPRGVLTAHGIGGNVGARNDEGSEPFGLRLEAVTMPTGARVRKKPAEA